MAIAARPLRGALGHANALQRLHEQGLELFEPAGLGAELEECLLGRRRHLEGGGHPVRIEFGERVRLGPRLGDLLDQVGVARAGAF